eukprot:2020047-Alexandrium_andersonii.AAC.1
MSASLVGSEMCIRDSRCKRSVWSASKAGRSGTGNRRGPGCAPVGSEARRCLLYTSDAADDM